jgi:hypothetical protein
MAALICATRMVLLEGLGADGETPCKAMLEDFPKLQAKWLILSGSSTSQAESHRTMS